jgi:hypothetical protein
MLGQILLSLDQARYGSLSFESIIGDLAEAFSASGKYRLLPEAMLAHDQNLRMQQLSELFNRCGIQRVSDWVGKHRALKAFFGDQPRQSDRADAELKQLVDYRNDAAHGGMEIDSVLGHDVLMEYADFLSAVFVALSECTQWSVIQRSIDYKKTRLVGKVNEVFSRNIVVAIVENSSFSVGDTIYLRGENYCYKSKILSLRVENVDVQSQIALSPIELGLRFDVEPRMAAEMYYFDLGSAKAEDASKVEASGAHRMG